LALLYLFRDKIRALIFIRKIKPIFNPMISKYKDDVLPEYTEEIPELKPVIKADDLPKEPPFGYIILPLGREDIALDVFLASIPVSSSLRRIRSLFDETLRKSLFDYLSYNLGIATGNDDKAIKFRDRAVREYPEDYEAIEKLYIDGRLTGIILNEAVIRLRKEKEKPPSLSSVNEFSKLVRKLSKINATLIRIGREPIETYVNKALKEESDVILLARGQNINQAVEVANRLKGEGFELFSEKELEFSNPEIGTWYFLTPRENEVSLMRIWLKRPKRELL